MDVGRKLLSTEPMLTYTWDEAAEVYVTFTVQNENGKAEEELKVEVLEMAPPVISLALPSKGLKVLQTRTMSLRPTFRTPTWRDSGASGCARARSWPKA